MPNLTKMLRRRCSHSATAIPHTPMIVEVVLFGGYPKRPKDFKADEDLSPIGNTVVLRFGESTSCVWSFLAENALL